MSSHSERYYFEKMREERERNKALEMYLSYDKNGDGFIDKEEFLAVGKEWRLPEELAARLFDDYCDRDNDGKLNYREYLRALEAWGPKDSIDDFLNSDRYRIKYRGPPPEDRDDDYISRPVISRPPYY